LPATWNAGVIGCGSIAQAMHMPGYAAARGVRLAAACDPDPARREEARRFGADLRIYDDYRRMLAAEKLDVVSVCSPNRFHAAHAIAALHAGAHVLLEKPAALSLREIAAIRAAVRQSRRKLIVGFSHRFQSGNLKARELLRRGAIGRPYMIRVRFAHSGPYPGWAKNDWFYKPALAGGGAMLDMGIHAIDQCLWLLGPVRSVQALSRTLRKRIRVDDNALMLLEFADGRALGYIDVGWTSPAGFNGLEIMGDEGMILIDYAAGMRLTTGKITPDLKVKPKLKTRLVDPTPTRGGWSVEIGECVKSFRRGEDRGSGIEAGGAALAVALAAYESSRTGKAVKVRPVP